MSEADEKDERWIKRLDGANLIKPIGHASAESSVYTHMTSQNR